MSEAEDVARREFGFERLKPAQAAAVGALLDGDDVLAVMATGYGKSAVFWVAGRLLPGPTVVVSPLIALQTDQVSNLAGRLGEHTAVAVNSSFSEDTNERSWAAIAAGTAEYVFLAPEQLARAETIERLSGLDVALFVVDEAHCVSSWGHDFRPDYLRLGAVIDAIGRPRVLALTATGASPVREEIVERLGMRDPRVLVGGFDRPNIHLGVVRHESDAEKAEAVVATALRAPSPGLVYVATRKDTERIAERLEAEGRRAAAYHGGLPARRRREVHEAFLDDELDIVVATSAFGMGVDKPNVRFVVHGDITDSLDAYAQEVGRSGRDGEPADATLHYRAEDLGLRKFFASGRPKPERVGAVASALATIRDELDDAAAEPVPIKRLADAVRIPPRAVAAIVNMLVEAELVSDEEGGVVASALLDVERAAAAVDEISERRERIDESRLAMIRAYAETDRCRREVLLEYFGEASPERCGNCDTCESGAAGDADLRSAENAADATDADVFRVDERVRHPEFGDGTVMSIEADRLTVFFEGEGYRVLSIESVEERGLLEAIS